MPLSLSIDDLVEDGHRPSYESNQHSRSPQENPADSSLVALLRRQLVLRWLKIYDLPIHLVPGRGGGFGGDSTAEAERERAKKPMKERMSPRSALTSSPRTLRAKQDQEETGDDPRESPTRIPTPSDSHGGASPSKAPPKLLSLRKWQLLLVDDNFRAALWSRLDSMFDGYNQPARHQSTLRWRGSGLTMWQRGQYLLTGMLPETPVRFDMSIFERDAALSTRLELLRCALPLRVTRGYFCHIVEGFYSGLVGEVCDDGLPKETVTSFERVLRNRTAGKKSRKRMKVEAMMAVCDWKNCVEALLAGAAGLARPGSALKARATPTDRSSVNNQLSRRPGSADSDRVRISAGGGTASIDAPSHGQELQSRRELASSTANPSFTVTPDTPQSVQLSRVAKEEEHETEGKQGPPPCVDTSSPTLTVADVPTIPRSVFLDFVKDVAIGFSDPPPYVAAKKSRARKKVRFAEGSESSGTPSESPSQSPATTPMEALTPSMENESDTDVHFDSAGRSPSPVDPTDCENPELSSTLVFTDDANIVVDDEFFKTWHDAAASKDAPPPQGADEIIRTFSFLVNAAHKSGEDVVLLLPSNHEVDVDDEERDAEAAVMTPRYGTMKSPKKLTPIDSGSVSTIMRRIPPTVSAVLSRCEHVGRNRVNDAAHGKLAKAVKLENSKIRHGRKLEVLDLRRSRGQFKAKVKAPTQEELLMASYASPSRQRSPPLSGSGRRESTTFPQRQAGSNQSSPERTRSPQNESFAFETSVELPDPQPGSVPVGSSYYETYEARVTPRKRKATLPEGVGSLLANPTHSLVFVEPARRRTKQQLKQEAMGIPASVRRGDETGGGTAHAPEGNTRSVRNRPMTPAELKEARPITAVPLTAEERRELASKGVDEIIRDEKRRKRNERSSAQTPQFRHYSERELHKIKIKKELREERIAAALGKNNFDQLGIESSSFRGSQPSTMVTEPSTYTAGSLSTSPTDGYFSMRAVSQSMVYSSQSMVITPSIPERNIDHTSDRMPATKTASPCMAGATVTSLDGASSNYDAVLLSLQQQRGQAKAGEQWLPPTRRTNNLVEKVLFQRRTDPEHKVNSTLSEKYWNKQRVMRGEQQPQRPQSTASPCPTVNVPQSASRGENGDYSLNAFLMQSPPCQSTQQDRKSMPKTAGFVPADDPLPLRPGSIYSKKKVRDSFAIDQSVAMRNLNGLLRWEEKRRLYRKLPS